MRESRWESRCGVRDLSYEKTDSVCWAKVRRPVTKKESRMCSHILKDLHCADTARSPHLDVITHQNQLALKVLSGPGREDKARVIPGGSTMEATSGHSEGKEYPEEPCDQKSRQYKRAPPAVTQCGQEKKRRRKSCHSIYEREELASYIPIAKPFLRHPSASGSVQLLCLPAHCPPARCRSGEARPVKCCFGMVPAGILPS